MSAPPIDPSQLQVQAPPVAPVPQAQPQPPPQAAPVAPAAPAAPVTPAPEPKQDLRDVVLTTEQTENLLRGFEADGPPAAAAAPPTAPQTAAEAEQAKMAGDFFSQVTPEVSPTAPPVQQVPGVAPAPQIPGAPQQVPAGMVQAAQQQVAEGFIQPGAQPLPAAPQAVVAGQQPAAFPPHIPGQPPQQIPIQQQPTPGEAAAQAQLAIMGQQLQAAQTELQQVRMGAAPQQPQQPQQPQGFNFNVPPQFMAAIGHEDLNVRQQAMNGLLNGVANAVAQQVRAETAQQMESVPEIVQTQTAQLTRRQEINQDMYGTYPELANFRHLVGPTAEQVARETQAADWNPNLRDEVARRLSPMIPGLFERVQQNMATRMAAPALPQAQVATGIPQHYAAVQAAPVQQQSAVVPMLVRDAQGNLIPVMQTPQQYQLPAGTRPGQGVAPNPEVADIWRTLGFS